MAGHMETIGIRGGSEEELGGLVGSLLRMATWEAMPGGGQMGTWKSPTGAMLTAHANPSGNVDCATPSFAGSSRLRVRPLGFREYRGCRYCDVLHVEVLGQDGGLVYPLALQIDDIGMTRTRIPMNRPIVMTIAAFAEEFQTWPDEKAFYDSQTGDTKFSSKSLIPSGLFGPEPQPHAMITGHVRSAVQKVNEVTGVPFVALVVDTFEGPYDVLVADSVAAAAPAPGTIVQGSFWMVGRVVEGLGDPPPPKGFFGRLFSR